MLALLAALFFSIPSGAMTSTQSNSVMVIDTSRRGGGSGFYVVTDSGNSYILTNEHVCGKDPDKIVIDQSGHESKVKVLFKDSEADLCALYSRYPHKGFRIAKQLPYCGEYVIFMGYPELQPFTVQATEHCDRVLLTTVKHGNSGSPVLNLDLEVVGVVDAMFKDSEQGLMLNLKLIRAFLEGK